MPSVATLISRVAWRYLGAGAVKVARDLAGAAAGEVRTGGERNPAPVHAPAPGRVARVVFALWLAGLALFVLVVLNIHLFLPDRASATFRLVVGSVLLIEGAALIRRLPFRALVLARLVGGSAQPGRIRRTTWKPLLSAGLTALGITWLALGVFNVIRGASALL